MPAAWNATTGPIEANRRQRPVLISIVSPYQGMYYFPNSGPLNYAQMQTQQQLSDLKQQPLQYFDSNTKTRILLYPAQVKSGQIIVDMSIPSIDNAVIDSQEERNAAQAQVNAQTATRTATGTAVQKVAPTGIAKVIAGIPKEKMIYVWAALGTVGVLLLLKMRKNNG